MSYREISGEFKVEMVLKLLKGESPAELEREYHIPKKTIYSWKGKAIEAMYQIFRHNPPGPKREDMIEVHKCDRLSQSVDMDSQECPECKKGALVKNGVYTLNSGVVKQRMFCKMCLFQITVEKKTKKFH